MPFQPDADGAFYAVANLERAHAFLLHVLDGAEIGALAEMGQELDRAAGKQPVGLAGGQVQPPRPGGQCCPGPAVERGLGRHGIGQAVAQAGVRVFRRRVWAI